jgi:hypothetical protein
MFAATGCLNKFVIWRFIYFKHFIKNVVFNKLFGYWDGIHFVFICKIKKTVLHIKT